jgi:hypothetical protein
MFPLSRKKQERSVQAQRAQGTALSLATSRFLLKLEAVISRMTGGLIRDT